MCLCVCLSEVSVCATVADLQTLVFGVVTPFCREGCVPYGLKESFPGVALFVLL